MGRKHTEESKKKMSEIAKKIKHKETQGFQKGHKLLGNNPTSKGKNWKLSDKNKENIRLSKLGKNNPSYGKKHSEEHKKKIGDKLRGILKIKDRTKLKKSERKDLDSAYKDWMLKVKNRDNWKCMLNSDECSGRLEAHHIFNWVDYPELRYILSNGITLCRFHHPIKRLEEIRMRIIFQELLELKN